MQSELTFANLGVDDAGVNPLHAFLSLHSQQESAGVMHVVALTSKVQSTLMKLLAYFVHNICLPGAGVFKRVSAWNLLTDRQSQAAEYARQCRE